MVTRRRPVIAIDGPVGAGKSTVARILAQRLGYRYVDTGAMYRSVAWQAERLGIDLRAEDEVAEVARSLRVEFVPTPAGQRVVVDGTDVTEAIRSPRVSEGASIVSAYPAVRRAMVALQRRMGADGGVVMEGRDIGTVVFPDAEVKIFLDASLKERARRRYEELRARGEGATFEKVLAALRERDQRDSTRRHSPLRAAPDALVVDSTHLTVDEVVERIQRYLAERR
ncbi:MAG: (d)CMP kinase [Armatimonadota bacterium]|nr:(d)CMP kinase [Armatimonadota bacterium]MDR7450347.1 (d)CMP kinase [Armatimonadota bacterium]MDR7467070.1 (d)CMP kinase [Armatimonadota bacterium]MDR7493388.1 (d)CMP kinase [Armatimonadota bacterium]MDR7499396.1 (d)CMP kinase [Armatimonadota bacterium]